MAAPPARTKLSDTYPNPSHAVAKAGLGELYDYAVGLLGATGNAPEALAALGANGRYSGYASISTTSTLTASAAGKLHTVATAAITITLPAGSAMRVGEAIHFYSQVAFTISRAGSDTIIGPGGATPVTTRAMYGNCSIAWTGAEWRIVQGGDQHLWSSPKGRIQLPGGLMVQFGSWIQGLNGAGVGAETFSPAFTAVYSLIVCNGDTASTTVMPGVSALNTVGFSVHYPTLSGTSVQTNWVAIGQA